MKLKGITKRGNKWQVRTTRKGESIYGSFLTREQAEKYLKARINRIDMGQYYEEQKTLREVYDFMDEEKRLKGKKKEQSSYYTTRDFVNHIAVLLNENRSIDSFTMDDMRNFQKEILKSDLSARTQGKIISLLKQIFKTALRQGWIKTDCSVILERPKVKKRENKVFTKEEQKKLFAEAEKTFNMSPNMLGFLALGFYGGLRIGEAIGLQWRDIDYVNHKVNIERQFQLTLYKFTEPKTEASKTFIPMCPELESVLKRIHDKVKGRAEYKETDCVLTSRQGRYTGKPLNRNTIYEGLKRLTVRCGLPAETRAHVLRKTFCTDSINERGLERTTAMMRHSKPSVTWLSYTNANAINEETIKMMYPSNLQKGA